MTRGPQPLMAIAAAQEIAGQRGTVLDNPALQRSHYNFVLFITGCTVFVRVKRIRTHISNPQEIERMFREEIQMLRTVPDTPVVSREIWVVSPWKTWQYFQVSDGRIVEVRCDGQPVLQEERLILKKTDNGNY
jgi:hypothetical protein